MTVITEDLTVVHVAGHRLEVAARHAPDFALRNFPWTRLLPPAVKACDCEKCAALCHKTPGWFAPGEAERAAELLGMPFDEFRDKYLQREYWMGGAFVLSPRKTSDPRGFPTATYETRFAKGRCAFLTAEDRCRIHEAKPTECRLALACEEQPPELRDGHDLRRQLSESWEAAGAPYGLCRGEEANEICARDARGPLGRKIEKAMSTASVMGLVAAMERCLQADKEGPVERLCQRALVAADQVVDVALAADLRKLAAEVRAINKSGTMLDDLESTVNAMFEGGKVQSGAREE